MFQSILATLVARTRARWAMIVGNDGVLLETDNHGFRAEAEGLAAEYATLYRSSRKTAGNTDLGALVNSQFVTEQGKVLFQPLTSEYFLVLALESDAHAGKAFFEISRACGSLEEELVF
jgi:predicted regulator of Ras-like GTPase activity (Roadblock/LC7/MglB family)